MPDMKESFPQKLERFDARLKKLIQVLTVLAGIALIVIMLIAFVNLTIQKLLHRNVPNSTDWICYMLIPVVYLAFPSVILSDKGPLSADVLSGILPGIVKTIISVFSYFLGMGLCGFITYRTYIYALRQIANKATNGVAQGSFYLWPFSLCLCIGMALCTILTAYTLVRFFVRKYADRKGGK